MKNSIFNAVCKTRYLALLVVLIFTCGNVWGDTYTLVTSNSSLSNGDKVVIAKNVSNQPGGAGVTGWNGSSDATVSATSSEWVQYTVSNASGSGWKLYDNSASKYIASPGGNEFKYSATAGICSVNNNGVLTCNSRYLVQNGSYYRMYTSIGSYIPFCVWKVTASSGGGCDKLDRAFTGIIGSTYTGWSNKSGSSSDAVYAGNSAGGNTSIQLRSSNNSGIVTTASGGTASSVTVTWNSNTQNGRTLDVYGKNTAYSSAGDLYNNSNQGTLLGSIVYGTSTELTITGSYSYIGLRSNSGAMYLSDVTICWGSTCSTDPTLGTPTLSGITSGTISVNCPSISAGSNCTIDDYGFVWVSGGSDPTISNNKTQKGTNNQSTAYSDNLSINFTTGTTYKIKAYAHNAHGNGLSTTSLTVIPQSITYNGNTSTSGSMSTQYVNRNTSTALTSNAFSKTGHTFAGWATSADGDVAYSNGQNVSIASNLSLYAKWTAKTTTVSFNQNSGTGGQTSNLTATYGSAMPAISGTPTRDHYTFDGYYDGTGGTGTKYYNTDGSSARNWDKEDAIWTLYAKWIAEKYTVTWSVNGSTYTTTSNVTYNTTTSTPANPTPSGDCAGSTFMGWTATEDYAEDTAPGDMFNSTSPAITGNITFYAVFADEE